MSCKSLNGGSGLNYVKKATAESLLRDSTSTLTERVSLNLKFRMRKFAALPLVAVVLAVATLSGRVFAETRVYEVVEKVFHAQKGYGNAYLEVDLWVELTGPGATYRIPAFWDGGNTFRARLVATAPGEWRWSTSNLTGDSGLDGKSGTFSAAAWTESEMQANPNRRGFIRPSTNNHTLEYADGTPFFYAGDTWWSALTRIYSWDSDQGKAGISFQDALALRKAQGFTGINMIACFPTDTVRGIWDKSIHGEKVAEDGSTPFEVSSDGDADYTRINPQYWQQADRKWRHMWENGFVPFIETVRRHEMWPWENEARKNAFTNYVRYLWARWGCYNMIFSWVHADAGNAKIQQAWSRLVVKAHAELGDGRLPYGQPRTVMCPGSSKSYWYGLSPRILDLNSVSNQGRDGKSIGWLREMFFLDDPLPVYNLEPYYPGVDVDWHPKPQEGMTDGQMAQFLMYGCVLNGGALVGHAWGDCYWGGPATVPKRPITAGDPHKNGFNRWTAASMGKLKDFILDSGHDYRVLVPAVKNLAAPDGELLCLALAPDKSQGLGFVSAGKNSCDIVELTPNAVYRVEWWHIDNGGWQDKTVQKADGNGHLSMPDVPGGDKRGWAFRILRSV
ncbi:MAG: DUF4038 domain-containing protein [Planctomycetes bacterium]|nr:DUF4038 domain-containing protein [Planctomycetota bacterium]